MRFIDIAVNLTDDMFQGNYRGKQVHEPDLPAVLDRSKAMGMETMIITGTSLAESKEALEMAERYDLYATVGCHPTSTKEISKREDVDAYFAELEDVIKQEAGKGADSRLVAIGEIGLDYDRLHHSDADTQRSFFPRLLTLGETYCLPLFLHSRHPDAHTDLVKTLRSAGWKEGLAPEDGADGLEGLVRGRTGVVHSFTGTVAEMNELLGFGLYIGINGCSLKTEENLQVISQIPLSRLMLETDAPWCSITSTSGASKHLPPTGHVLSQVGKVKSFKPGQGVKGRNEPADIGAVAYVVAQVMGKPVEAVAQAAWENTVKVFFPHRKDWL
ncbi:hypothetical protein QFC22_002930 [Naganishia vaughanmartiniae]|uniref:Uncharacterized protein n=1 Tax=Naganishia vaughanmartiniae TaxID=1424756 RepID=A0ACC2X8U6_9TREE|nr:hypothetical protein QFC22_002930 [Naganishia vaughanmartiniae]